MLFLSFDGCLVCIPLFANAIAYRASTTIAILHRLLRKSSELHKLKVKIPEEVGVVGFSNEPFTKYMELPMSSIDQTPVTMGEIAAQVFLEQINNKQHVLSVEKRVVLAPELVIRKSSNKAKSLIKGTLHVSTE